MSEKIDKLELLKRLAQPGDDAIEEYMNKTDEEVRADLEAAGVDPEAARERIRARVTEAISSGPTPPGMD